MKMADLAGKELTVVAADDYGILVQDNEGGFRGLGYDEMFLIKPDMDDQQTGPWLVVSRLVEK